MEKNLDSSLKTELLELIDRLPDIEHGNSIARALATLVRMANTDLERLDWKILTASCEDLENGFKKFYPYRHIRKIAIFGGSRISVNSLTYRLAVDFARCVSQLGFMVITGAGGGIMQAANEGAGREHSFGLNIQLPFEQQANPFIFGDDKLINFKYFFTRKLFFLRESDAIALFPGGFGTQDEAFETLTLCQTGKYGPAPLVLIDEPGGNYWRSWNEHISNYLVKKGLISPEDTNLYAITDRVDLACGIIRDFYRVYHSSRYVGKQFVMRLNYELSDEQVEGLNQKFSDILVAGRIEKSQMLPQEKDKETADLPRLVFYFNQRDFGKLYQLIGRINQLETKSPPEHYPEQK